MNKPYVEQDCCITHEGREYCAPGAVVTVDWATCYLSADLHQVKTWHGEVLGPATVTAQWRTPGNCYISAWQYQVEAMIDGVKYTGRTFGGNMLWRGKRKARQ